FFFSSRRRHTRFDCDWSSDVCSSDLSVRNFARGVRHGANQLPIGYVYGQLVSAMPDASGEVAYTAQVFPRGVSYATGWMMLLARSEERRVGKEVGVRVVRW